MLLQSLFTAGRAHHPDGRRTVTYPALVVKKRYRDERVFANFRPVIARFGMWKQPFRYNTSFPQLPIEIDDGFLDWEFAGPWTMRSRQQTRTQARGETLSVRHTIWLTADEDVLVCRLRGLFDPERTVFGPFSMR